MTEPVKVDNAKPVIRQSFWLFKAATATKVGKQAHGGLRYEIFGDVDRNELNVTITANEGGGYFSREVVPFIKIKACLNHAVPGKAFPSKLFREAFIGRSANNAGFLAAILRAEGLLARAPDTETQHIQTGDWDTWQKAMLSEAGQMIEKELPVPAIEAVEPEPADVSPPIAKNPKTLSIKRSKPEVSHDAAEAEEGDSDHAISV